MRWHLDDVLVSEWIRNGNRRDELRGRQEKVVWVKLKDPAFVVKGLDPGLGVGSPRVILTADWMDVLKPDFKKASAAGGGREILDIRVTYAKDDAQTALGNSVKGPLPPAIAFRIEIQRQY